jgi:nucleoside-diphosphate-sugar epimerase
VVNVSSTSAIGIAWSQRGLSPLVVPVRESHPYVGDDVYGLSKQIGEVVAGAASRRWGIPVVSLRFPFIGTGERLRGHLARIHADVAVDRAGLWAWVDTRDAARAVSAAVVASLDGHHIVNVTAPDTTALVPTAELVRRFHPDALIEVEPCGFATVFDTVRSRESLGFEAVYGWRV